MDRRNFLKTFLGNDISSTLKWAVALLLIILFFSVDFNNLQGIASVAGFFIVGILALIVLAIILNFIRELLKKIIPQSVINWLNKNKKIIEYIILILLTGYLVYWAIKNERYGLLIFWAAYGIISYIFNRKPKRDKKQTNISADASIRE